MKFYLIFTALAGSLASAVAMPVSEKLAERGGGVVCLEVCAGTISLGLPVYAACLASCTAAGQDGGEPADIEAMVAEMTAKAQKKQ